MTRFNGSGAVAMGAMAAAMFSVGLSLAVVACGSQPSESAKAEAAPVSPASAVSLPAVAPVTASVGVAAPILATTQHSPASTTPTAPKPRSSTPRAASDVSSADGAGLAVKRFVVSTGVLEREPLPREGALPSDGSPVYAFAELVNSGAEASNVRITFQRHGSNERVGNVTLAVPAHTTRHRTWANTRFIREAGTWDAVLWSERGTELGRATFDANGG